MLADVEDVCDRIAILYGGKIQSEGKVKDLLQQTDKREITTGLISDTAVEKIKQIVQGEQADCIVTSPMDKLETFFIKTVTAAQQQGLPTSGVVSDATTQISSFLIPKTTEENILDKLVSAPASPEVSTEPPTTKKAVPVDSSEPKPDDQLLSKLTEQAKSAPPKLVVRNGKEKTEPVEKKAGQQEQTKKSILDQLTGRSKPKNRNKEQTGKSQGDSSDA
ncbi:hypothetical protein ES703_73905 [subsurface metagenome]